MTPFTVTADTLALAAGVAQLVTLVIEHERLLDERAEARAQTEILSETNRRMEEFISIAGHELRTPLTSVLGNVQLATRWLSSMQQAGETGAGPTDRVERTYTVLKRMERQGLLLARLVNDLLESSRLHGGTLALHPAPCDLQHLVSGLVSEHQQRLPERPVELQLGSQPLIVEVDADRISQVLTNLLGNAVKYSEPWQPITVGVVRQFDTAQVFVRDAGPGIAPGDQERIWDRFYRVSSTVHRDGSSVGLGLGLYICRTIVERHGGAVGVESEVGTGSTFWFSVPLSPQAAQ